MTSTLASLKQQWDNAIAPTLYAQDISKQLMPVNPELSNKGIGVLSIDALKYVARGAAVTNYDIQNDIEDTVELSGTTLKIPVQQDDIKIKRRDWEAYVVNGIPIGSDMALDMAANIAVQRTSLVVDGWKPDGTNYAIKGLYQVANNTVSGQDFDTFGNAYKTVAAALKELKTDYIYSPGYNLVLSGLNYAELMGSIATNGVAEADSVMALLNRDAPPGTQPGRIFEGVDLAAGTGLVAPIAAQSNLRYFDLVETQEPVNHLWFEDGNEVSGDVKARQVGALVPRFKHLNSAAKDNCVCTITGLDSS